MVMLLVTAGEKDWPDDCSFSTCVASGNILAIGAPSTTKCNFCATYQCGLNVHGDCFARSPASQSLYKIAHISDLLLSQQLFFDCFNANSYEMEIFIDYMMAQSVSPVQIYKEVLCSLAAPITLSDQHGENRSFPT